MRSLPLRKNEVKRTWSRSDRVVLREAGNWYFRTREGIEIGPYETHFEAEIEAGLLIELLQKVTDGKDCFAIVDKFIHDGVAMGHELSPVPAKNITAAISG